MTWWLPTLAGLLVLVFLLVDIFRTLALPSSSGMVVRGWCHSLWWVSRALGHRVLGRIVGPSAMVLTIISWAVLLVLGWALIYWPHLPAEFSYGATLEPAQRSTLLDSVYISGVYAATLGLGDVVPLTSWLRLVVPVQAMLGFATFTAAVTWVLQVYPALVRRRALALLLDGLWQTDTADLIRERDSVYAATVMYTLAQRVSEAAVDLEQYHETYFFRDAGPRSSLPRIAAYLMDLVEAGRSSAAPEVRSAAETLLVMTQRLADVLQPIVGSFEGEEDGTERVLEAYCDDHHFEACRS